MERDTRLILGAVLVAGGLGAGAYFLAEYLRGRSSGNVYVRDPSVTTNPSEPLSPGRNAMAATLSWINPSNQTVTYGVQAATVQNGIVTGRWFTDAAVAIQAVELYNKGDIAGANALATTPAYRVKTVTLAPGAQGLVDLFELIDIQPGQEWWFWIMPSPPPGQLAVTDQTGQPVSGLPAGLRHVVQLKGGWS